jgi:hypothetical protein
VTELRFHRELYAGAAIDEAVKVYARFATFELSEESAHWVVRVSAKSEARAVQVARELANYALGTTIRARGARS